MRLQYNIYHHGFTLVETVLAILILSFALLAIAGLQIIALQGNTFANQISQSTLLAQDRIESLMLLNYSHPDLFDDTPIEEATTYIYGSSPGGYEIKWHVNSDMPAIGHKTVNVEVHWKALGGTKKFTLSFIKSDA